MEHELSRMRKVKESRCVIQKKEDVMIRRKFEFLHRITRLNGEIKVKKNRLHLNITMKLSTNLFFDGSRLTSVRTVDRLLSVASDADRWKCFVMFALSCACGH